MNEELYGLQELLRAVIYGHTVTIDEEEEARRLLECLEEAES